MNYLPHIQEPNDFRGYTTQQLQELCNELRLFVPETTQDKPAHILASLAVTELTVALHYLLNTPNDILIWDVGHQAYVHKVLTNRKSQFVNNRKMGGPSGFPTRKESVYDAFGTGHSSTSISALGGMWSAAQLLGEKKKFVAVIGDGALTGGEAYEALNHLGSLYADILIVLNDNQSSIDPNVGALHKFNNYQPFFESLHFSFLGSENGNNIAELLPTLKSAIERSGPRVLRISTVKPKGVFPKQKNTQLPLQMVFGQTLVELAKKDPRITGISPAMLSGCSMDIFQNEFPERTFDTGITEQHAVTFAAGQAAAGLRPFVNLYSTFAQRAYDQIIHDVALQQLPVVFCLERAGLVGEDGPTHHGAFDLSFLLLVPNLRIYAPQSGTELRALLHQSLSEEGPVVIRYPKTESEPIAWDQAPEVPVPFRVIHSGKEVLVVSTGFITNTIKEVITRNNLDCTHVHLTQIKPLPATDLKALAQGYQKVITFEENTTVGGLGSAIAQLLSAMEIPVINYGLPDDFVQHGSISKLETTLGLDAAGILEKLRS